MSERTATSIFLQLDDHTFMATPAAAGPWSDSHCHGGAPAALLASAIDGGATDSPMDLAKLAVDLLKPVPVGRPLRLEMKPRQQGRRLQVIAAELLDDGQIVATATGLRLRSLPYGSPDAPVEPPDSAGHRPMPGGFSRQFTIVPVKGGFGEPGPADVWFRLNTPLLPGLSTRAVAITTAAADFGSGAAHALPFDDWQFPSLDLTVNLARRPQGEWTRLTSRWMGVDGGRTTCVTRLADLHGEYGQAVQTVLLEPRASRFQPRGGPVAAPASGRTPT